MHGTEWVLSKRFPGDDWKEAGAGAGEELAEDTVEEAMCREDEAVDGEASRSADSISVKHNPVSTLPHAGDPGSDRKTHV